MPSVLRFALEYLLWNALIVAFGYLAASFIRARWPNWWERWIVAPYPDEADDYPRL